MSVDDNWGEVLRKSAIDLLLPNGKAKVEYALRTGILNSNGDPISTAEPLPVEVVEAGAPTFFDDGRLSTPGSDQILIDQTVPINFTWRLKNVVIVSRFQSQWQLLANGTPIAGGRTGAARPSSGFPFLPYRLINSTVELQLVFSQTDGTPAAWVESYLQLEQVPN